MYNKKQSDLLRESIIKWEDIVNRTDIDKGTDNCALCQEYFSNDACYCEGCPVYNYTGLDYCHGTPYWSWVDSTGKASLPHSNLNDKTQKAAEDELEFLEILLERTILLRDLTL